MMFVVVVVVVDYYLICVDVLESIDARIVVDALLVVTIIVGCCCRFRSCRYKQ